MKTSNIVRGMIVALLGLGTATAARADERVVVHVPFDFVAGTTQLPAGDYVVTEDVNDAQGVVSIESAVGRQCVFALTIAATALRPSPTELVFRKFENRYFLSKVASEGGLAREIPLTSKIMESELAQVHTATQAPVTPD
jgi:hypothetical protein